MAAGERRTLGVAPDSGSYHRARADAATSLDKLSGLAQRARRQGVAVRPEEAVPNRRQPGPAGVSLRGTLAFESGRPGAPRL